MSAPEDRHDARRLERFDACRTTLVLEHRELSKDLARAECRERQCAAPAVLADRTGAAGVQDVARIACIPLAEDELAGCEQSGHGQLGDLLQVALLQRSEHRHAGKQLDYLR